MILLSRGSLRLGMTGIVFVFSMILKFVPRDISACARFPERKTEMTDALIEAQEHAQEAAKKLMNMKCFEASKASEPLFDYLLATVEESAAMAFTAAKGIDILKSEPRDIARQRRMNQMVENGIVMLEELFNITVACTRSEQVNTVPFPPSINRRQTLLNFANKR